jgi:subfamily B ATP-binding cassette protein MsbA
MAKHEKTKFLFEIIKPYKHAAALVILLSMLGSCFDGISIGLLVPLLGNLQKMNAGQNWPVIFRWLAELLRPYSVQQQIMLSIGFVLTAILLKNLFIMLSIGLGHWLSHRLQADLRLKAMTLLMRVGIEFHQQAKVTELVEKAMEHTSQMEFFMRMFIELTANLLTLLVLVAMLFILSWPLTLLTLLLGAIFFIIISQYTKSARRLGQQGATTKQDLMNAVYESLSGIQLIKSYSKEQEQIPLLHEKIEASRRMTFRRTSRFFGVHPLTDVLGAIAIVVLFLLAMRIYKMDTQLILTQLLPFVYILLRMVPLTKIINGQRTEIAGNRSYVDFVYGLLRVDDKPFIAEGRQIFSSLQREIQFRNVAFVYNGKPKAILRNINFAIPAGKTTAIIGESGAGKSTIANLLLRFYDPQHGTILLDGEPLPNFQLVSYHRKIGIVSQDTFLFGNTVKFNIAFGAIATPSDEQIIAAAKKAGAHEFIMDLSNGYDTFIGDRGVKLSGGQRQRIAIARAILRDPEILILDEATSALDAKTERRIHQAILELSQGRTVIIIAHRLSTIKNADQIIVLKNGQVAEIGHPEELLERGGEYCQLAQAQL